MHDDSHSILARLADGQEVLGINGALFSTALRTAFADGAEALKRLAAVRALVRVEALVVAAPAVVQAAVEVPAALTPEPVPVETKPESVPEPKPEVVPVQPAAVAEPPTPTPSVAAVEPEPLPVVTTEPPVAPVVEEPAAQPEPETAPSVVSGDEDYDRMPDQSDEPDANGWRPSEDAMLLDEFVGLGLTIEEVAENHGREVSDIVNRLRCKHGVDVEGYEDTAPATSEVPAAPAVVAVPAVESPAAEPPVAVAASVPAAAVEAPATDVATPDSEPALSDYEAVIEFELKRASPEAVLFATGVLRHMERAPAAVGQLQDYLQTAKARAKLSDKLRLALLAKVVARLKAA